MIDPKFVEYIRHQLTTGVAREDIKKALAINGLSEPAIAEAFEAVVSSAVPAHPTVVPEVAPPASSLVSVSATTQEGTHMPVLPRPESVRRFEMVMYASIFLGVIAMVYQAVLLPRGIWSGVFGIMAVITPTLAIILQIFVTWAAAHRRANWARYILLVPLLLSVIGLQGVIFFLFSDPILGLLNLAPFVLAVIALGFVFSASANAWFSSEDSATTTPLETTINRTWTRGIVRSNQITLTISLVLVFGLDLAILAANPGLFGFWAAMVFVLGLFGIFYYIENSVLARKFERSHSRIDYWILSFVGIRNFTFVLNFIPGIQILGAIALVFGGIPYLLLYAFLLSRRRSTVV